MRERTRCHPREQRGPFPHRPRAGGCSSVAAHPAGNGARRTGSLEGQNTGFSRRHRLGSEGGNRGVGGSGASRTLSENGRSGRVLCACTDLFPAAEGTSLHCGERSEVPRNRGTAKTPQQSGRLGAAGPPAASPRSSPPGRGEHPAAATGLHLSECRVASTGNAKFTSVEEGRRARKLLTSHPPPPSGGLPRTRPRQPAVPHARRGERSPASRGCLRGILPTASWGTPWRDGSRGKRHPQAPQDVAAFPPHRKERPFPCPVPPLPPPSRTAGGYRQAGGRETRLLRASLSRLCSCWHLPRPGTSHFNTRSAACHMRSGGESRRLFKRGALEGVLRGGGGGGKMLRKL